MLPFTAELSPVPVVETHTLFDFSTAAMIVVGVALLSSIVRAVVAEASMRPTVDSWKEVLAITRSDIKAVILFSFLSFLMFLFPIAGITGLINIAPTIFAEESTNSQVEEYYGIALEGGNSISDADSSENAEGLELVVDDEDAICRILNETGLYVVECINDEGDYGELTPAHKR